MRGVADFKPGRRAAEAVKELLLSRLMAVHPEVYDGRVLSSLGYLIEIDLSERPPRYVKLPSEFMGFPVEYHVTGWKPDLMPCQE